MLANCFPRTEFTQRSDATLQTLKKKSPRSQLGFELQLLAATCAALLAGCDLPRKPNPANRPTPVNENLNFESLYQANCAGCHGAHGQLGPGPPLNDPLFLAIAPAEEILRVITHGRAGTPMPAFAQRHGGPLTDAQLAALAKGIKAEWGQTALPDSNPPPYLHTLGDPATSSDDHARGREVFAVACAGCHGNHGEGGKPDDGMVKGPINDPAFLALISDRALRRYIITGRPDLGMPNFASGAGRPADFRPLDSGQIDALVALLAHWRQSGITADAGPTAGAAQDLYEQKPLHE